MNFQVFAVTVVFIISSTGIITGGLSGKISLVSDGKNCILDLGPDGVFRGIIKASSNFAVSKPARENIETINFSVLNDVHSKIFFGG